MDFVQDTEDINIDKFDINNDGSDCEGMMWSACFLSL